MIRILAILTTLLLSPGCAVLDVVEGFRQFGGKPVSTYGQWRTRQLERQTKKDL
jgi:hypothetical protein